MCFKKIWQEKYSIFLLSLLNLWQYFGMALKHLCPGITEVKFQDTKVSYTYESYHYEEMGTDRVTLKGLLK